MTTDKFNITIEKQMSLCKSILCLKAVEYATQDRLHNFKVAAVIENCTPVRALGGMMAKHTVSVYDMINSGKDYPMELWDEKITDSINYLLLLKAMVEEGKENGLERRCGADT